MRLVATFTACMADRIRNAEVVSDSGLEYVVHVGDERSGLMAAVLRTPSLTEALKRASGWMDDIWTRERE